MGRSKDGTEPLNAAQRKSLAKTLIQVRRHLGYVVSDLKQTRLVGHLEDGNRWVTTDMSPIRRDHPQVWRDHAFFLSEYANKIAEAADQCERFAKQLEREA